MLKFLLVSFWAVVGLFGLLVFGSLGGIVLSSFTSLEVGEAEVQPSWNLDETKSSDLRPDGELADAFSFFSSYTELQREQLEERIRGKVVDWNLPVFDVSVRGKDEFVIQTDGTNYVGTFCNVRVSSEEQKSRVARISPGQYIRCKGVIKGVTLRNIILEPAVLPEN